MLSLAGERQTPKVLDHYLHHDLVMLLLLWRIFFAHLLILEYLDHHHNLIISILYYPGPLHKISSQSIHNVLSNVVPKQTNRQTDKPNATKNITSFGKEVITTATTILTMIMMMIIMIITMTTKMMATAKTTTTMMMNRHNRENKIFLKI